MNIDNVKLYKTILENQKEVIALQKENKDLKKDIKSLTKKIDIVLDKIQEFEIVFDAADIIEEHMENNDNNYSTEWNPYEDEDFDIENYNDEEDDGHF